MYKIDVIDQQVVDNYANSMANRLKPIIDDYLNGQALIVPVDNQDIQVVVINGSLTHKVLTLLSDLENLKKLLKLNFSGQYKFIQSLHKSTTPDKVIFKKLGKTTYQKHYNGQSPFIDHFNEIIYDIFVIKGYEQLLDKDLFIQNTHLKICPYCGNDRIIESKRSKNEIDHFLPKRKYPFFALSYFNLIPSCHFCNRADHKGQLSPIDEFAKGRIIRNPYAFNPDIVRFHLDIADINVYEPENFRVVVGFIDKRFLDGYDRFFDVCDRYADNNQEASEDYTKLMDFKADFFYDEMNVDRTWLQKAYRAVLGYSPGSDTPYIKEKYRMRTDVFKQLNKLRQPGAYYVKGYGNNAIELE